MSATTKDRHPWRNSLRVHPAAESMPVMPPVELQELAEDIKVHGLRSPIVLYDDGVDGWGCVLDGRSRLDALDLLGVDLFTDDGRLGPHFAWPAIKPDAVVDPVAWVISTNIRRRHLATAQKRDLIAKLLIAAPNRSNNAIAKIVCVDDKTVGTVRRTCEGRGEIPKVATTIGADGRSRPAARARNPTTMINTLIVMMIATRTKVLLRKFRSCQRRRTAPMPCSAQPRRQEFTSPMLTKCKPSSTRSTRT